MQKIELLADLGKFLSLSLALYRLLLLDEHTIRNEWGLHLQTDHCPIF